MFMKKRFVMENRLKKSDSSIKVPRKQKMFPHNMKT